MPAGFESFRDGGGFQLVSDTPMISLDRIEVRGAGPMNDKGYATVYIPMNGGEMVAINTGGMQAAVVGKQSGQLIVAVPGVNYPTLECYFFRQHTWSGLNYGMQIFDGAGNLTYDTGRPPFNIVTDTWGPGNYWLPGERKYAVLYSSAFVEIETKVEYIFTGGGPAPDYMTFEWCTTDFFRTYTDRVSVERVTYHSVVGGPYPAWQGTGVINSKANNGQASRWFVVDVTNFR